jgi:hypothetical protein
MGYCAKKCGIIDIALSLDKLSEIYTKMTNLSSKQKTNMAKRMNIKNTIFIFLSLSSTSLYCTSSKTDLKEQEKLLWSLSKQKDLLELDPKILALYIQNLKENKAVLKYIIAHETGFFNNFDMVKGIVGMWLGTLWFARSALAIFVLMRHQSILFPSALSSPSCKEEFEKDVRAYRSVVIPSQSLVAIFSLWLIKISSKCLYRGWYKKGDALKELAEIDERLALAESIQ